MKLPGPAAAAVSLVLLVPTASIAQDEPAEGIQVPDPSGDLLDFYTYEPFDGETPAHLDLLSVELTVEGEDLVVSFGMAGPVPDDAAGTAYALNLDRDEDGYADGSVLLSLGRDAPHGTLEQYDSGESVLLDAPVITDGTITAHVPLDAFGPFEGVTASAEVSAEWLADPEDIFSGVFVADLAPGLDEAWTELDTLAGPLSLNEGEVPSASPAA